MARKDPFPNRPKNPEVENEMIGWVEDKGKPPHSATEPVRKESPEKADAAGPDGRLQ